MKTFFLAASMLMGTYGIARGSDQHSTQSDSLYNYTIHGEARMFMCPFLSPKFMDVLKKECQCEVVKTKDYSIQLGNSLPIDVERILMKAEEIGYQRSMITIDKVD